MNREVIQYVDLESLKMKPQVRGSIESDVHDGLARSIKAVGLQQPIRVRREAEARVVVDGERRCRAARLLGWKQIAAILEDRALCPAEVLQRQLIANCQRKSLKPIEFSRGIEELIEATGWTLSEVIAMTGFSLPMISKHRPLVNLAAPIQQKVEAGEIAADTAYHLARISDPVQQQEMADAAASGQLTRDAACAKVNAAKNGAAPAEKTKLSRFTVAAELGSVSISGPELTAETIIGLLSEVLSKARKLHSRGVSGDAFVRALREVPGRMAPTPRK
jgi:ParB family chromosome partitioning protein